MSHVSHVTIHPVVERREMVLNRRLCTHVPLAKQTAVTRLVDTGGYSRKDLFDENLRNFVL